MEEKLDKDKVLNTILKKKNLLNGRFKRITNRQFMIK